MAEDQVAKTGGANGPLAYGFSGARAGIQYNQQQDQQRMQEAQQQLQNQLRVQQAQREQNAEGRADRAEKRADEEAAGRKQLLQATLAHDQIDMVKKITDLNNATHAEHLQAAEADSGTRQALDAAGIPYTTITEDQWDEYKKAHPDYPGTVKAVFDSADKMNYTTDDKGVLHYSSPIRLYQINDPKTQVPINDSVRKMGKDLMDSGMYPGLADILKNNKAMSVDQFLTFEKAAKQATADAVEKQKQSLTLKEIQAQINAHNATTVDAQARAALSRQQLADLKLNADEKKEMNDLDLALSNPKAFGINPETGKPLATTTLNKAEDFYRRSYDVYLTKLNALEKEKASATGDTSALDEQVGNLRGLLLNTSDQLKQVSKARKTLGYQDSAANIEGSKIDQNALLQTAVSNLLGPQKPPTLEAAIDKLDAIPSDKVDPKNGLSDANRKQMEAEIGKLYGQTDAAQHEIAKRQRARASERTKETLKTATQVLPSLIF